ncbi:DUF7520 family protein [Halohasta litorea]|uniref:Cox cluster protein n=1 Tax=Halohasta litorea TaxID=869891 RepID=A0ABD6D682_9EURY|nr:hypothetical protein [Halohasta litorea]
MSSGLRGQRVVVGIYLIIVAFTGVAGYMTATVVGEIDPPRLLFLIEVPPTPIGLAVFGAGTIGFVLGVLLVAVTVVSDRFDDAEPGDSKATTPSTDPSTEPAAPSDESSQATDEPTGSANSPTDTTDDPNAP